MRNYQVAAPCRTLALAHWVLTRLVGGLLRLVGAGCWACDAAHPEPPGPTAELFAGAGIGLATGLLTVWSISSAWLRSLPRLGLLPRAVRQALAVPGAATRRWRFFSTVVGGQLLPPVLGAGYVLWASRERDALLILLGMSFVYAPVAAGVAWVLYACWLARRH